MAPQIITSREIYLLPLNDDGSPQVTGEYVYLAPETSDPFILRITIEGSSPICRHGSLWINAPEVGTDFDRRKFREFKLVPDFTKTIEIDITIHKPGVFAYYVTYAELPPITESLDTAIVSSDFTKTSRTYYVDVAPFLTLNDRPLPLPAISLITILSKSMGRYPRDWRAHFQGISQRGYNMVHFTPLQVRGESNSPFSLYDQLGWDLSVFPQGETDIAEMVGKLRKEHSLLSLTDIVLNHTASNSHWLQEHPESGYNLVTAPWLESAYLLDSKLLELSRNLATLGLPTELTSVDDLVKIMDAVKTEVIAVIRLWEYYVIDVDRDADMIVDAWVTGNTSLPAKSVSVDISTLKHESIEKLAGFVVEHGMQGKDRMGERFRRFVDPQVGANLLDILFGKHDEHSGSTPDAAAVRARIIEILDAVNVPLYREYDEEVNDIMEQLFNRIKYVRLDSHGPKLGPINDANPLIETYFTRLPINQTTEKFPKEQLVLVNNGWVWAGNALIDNAGPDTRVYLRREVIIWGDCVKLRYGQKPEDSPYLWNRMTEYARLLATYFDGLRIDNAHSTPIHVAEHILDEARRVRPNLYVVAELFTGSEEMDYVFVKRLGISALIREAMQAWSTGELSRLVHRHGGRPIGSFDVDEITRCDVKNSPTSPISPHVSRDIIHNIKAVPVQALFMDCTHDNETPYQKREARDTLPNAALVSMCSSATGSVFGYDEIYPKLIELVHEKRLYHSEYSFPSSSTSSAPSREIKIGSGNNGIGTVKKLLNQIHTLMGKDGYDETHIHHEDQYITVHRVHPQSRKGYFLIAHTAFPGYGNGNGAFNPVHLKGTRARHLGSWTLKVDTSDEAVQEVLNDKQYLRGLPCQVVDLPGIKMEVHGDETQITVRERFPPGSIALFETWIPTVSHSTSLDNYLQSGSQEAFGSLSLTDLNLVMYRCEAEERDFMGDGVYNIPGHGPLVYAGLQGWWSVLKDVVRENNLAHPLCQNLRDGFWSLDYIVGRMERLALKPDLEHLVRPMEWLRDRFNAIREIPSFLAPRYFALIIRSAYNACWDRSMSLMSPHIQNGQWFVQSLAMVGVQTTGFVPSGSLWPRKQVPSLSAGLPFFAVEWARCWGRDIFIALRGLYLGTGRYSEAKEHILAFASVLKHGMIPNLLGSGNVPRYNSRDSIWFFLQAIQDYVKIVPNGADILKETVQRRFLPYDDTWFPVDDERAYSQESTVFEVIQEALQRHAWGMSFREANAGPSIDSQMRDEGFQLEIMPDWNTGFIFGGNQFNCGTWMDKMGESERAGSKGIPGTPRDGAAVEIIGLLYSTLRWLGDLHQQGLLSHDGVTKKHGDDSERIRFSEWADLIENNFERCFYVPREEEDAGKYDIDLNVVNRRGIYKDLYRSGKPYEDYQLRPNFPIAMAVAPQLFDPDHALGALAIADHALRGPTGMATLDPKDMNYRPYYHNSEDSEDFATSKGRNYHQGPEWVWPRGYFLRSLLRFLHLKSSSSATNSSTSSSSPAEVQTQIFQQVTRRLRGCKEMIRQSPWAGLAELTQKSGEYCADSCQTQAWSASCLLDVYMDAAEIAKLT